MYLSLLHVDIGKDPESPRPGRLWVRDVYRVHQRLWMAFPDADRLASDPFFLGDWNGPPLPEPRPKRSEAGFLFRVERDGRPRILVQSVQRPDWEYAFQNAPYLLARKPQVRQFGPDPRRGQAYRFRLLANVVKSKSVAHPSGKTRTTRSGLTIRCRRRTEILIRPEPLPEQLPVDPCERDGLVAARWDPWRDWMMEMGAVRGFHVCVDDQRTPLLMEDVHISVRRPGAAQTGLRNGDKINRRFNGGLFDGVLVCTEPDALRDAVISGVGHSKAFGFGLLSLAPLR